MADQSGSQLTQVEYKQTLLLFAIDMTAPPGLKNVTVPASAVVAAGTTGSSEGALTVDSLTTVLTQLPTTLPSQPGVLWLNGGLLCLS